ncbi:PilZ domain-containing protein [Rhodopseudomonas palustris]|uniref:Type IV pilus assembly PilZ n=1 Tax=Rhodopseudomonas palustris (strain BisB5) TaxID=316057 RepID=Q130A0_RHOPS|nr:type IV pilus assembly PilZ [Rhodopseudomonas palustris BisB5]MBB1091901.1 PilZ domain-containing protein [Rhodopseudomonas palustris]
MEDSVDEKRRHPRSDVEEPAHVSFNGTSLSCLVRNISAEGAAIDVANAAYIPERFRLVTTLGKVLNCRLVWIKRNRIGVAFET